MSRYRFYGMTHSLYSGKARSYLTKQHVDFEEISAGNPHYHEHVLPKIGRWIIPVLETPDGELVQDGAAIIDWFEQRGLARQSAFPTSPRQRVVSQLFELFGGEGLLRPAMHYRWNFDADNKAFIEDQFGLFAMPHLPPAERLPIIATSTGRMRAAGEMFGVVPENFGLIEEAYVELLDELNDHFSTFPYLLGGRPTIGDYGLIAPLFAHLGRDPHPASLMKQRAPAVYRWTERMNARGPDMPEFMGRDEDLLADDQIPASLEVLMRRVATDYLPEIEAFVSFQNQWCADNADVPEGSPVGGEKKVRGIGMCSFDWRGRTLKAGVLPYRSWLLQRVQDSYDQLPEDQRNGVLDLFTGTGLALVLTTRASRRVERQDNGEVWGAWVG